MHVVPTLWIVWAVFAVILLSLLLYRGTITRYEDDQLFLDDISERQHKENDAIIARVAQLQPFSEGFYRIDQHSDRGDYRYLRLGRHQDLFHVDLRLVHGGWLAYSICLIVPLAVTSISTCLPTLSRNLLGSFIPQAT